MLNAIYRHVCSISSLRISSFAIILLANTVFLSGCAVTPSSIVKQPTTARAPAPSTVAKNDGAIFNTGAYRPMFEDRRPRFVGDIVTINIIENTSAKKAGASSASKNGDVSFSADAKIGDNIPFIGGLISKLPYANKSSLSATSANSYDDAADANSSNVFTGSVTTTVTEVLPNGNLMVSGEKQVALDKGTEFVRFSGVVNPDTITQGNSVASTKVADARIEYRTNSKIDAASVASIFARFFLSLSPW